MKCTNKEQETCEVEKRGCEGCFYYQEEEEEVNEQKVSKCTNNKSDKTN